jgi:hypothetical protein
MSRKIFGSCVCCNRGAATRDGEGSSCSSKSSWRISASLASRWRSGFSIIAAETANTTADSRDADRFLARLLPDRLRCCMGCNRWPISPRSVTARQSVSDQRVRWQGQSKPSIARQRRGPASDNGADQDRYERDAGRNCQGDPKLAPVNRVRSGLIDEHVALLSHDQPAGNMGRWAIPTIVGVEAQSGLLA